MNQQKEGWWVPEKMAASGPGSYISRSRHIESALSHHVGERRGVIQAGGHIGIWPKFLSECFEIVITFEARTENWECIAANTDPDRVLSIFGALGERISCGSINIHAKSTGGHHTLIRTDHPSQEVPVYSIDSLPHGLRIGIDAIFLDVEGYELHALRGAMKTIEANKPTLVIEENGCSKKFGGAPGDIEKMLAPLGYRKVAAYDEDIVLIAREP